MGTPLADILYGDSGRHLTSRGGISLDTTLPSMAERWSSSGQQTGTFPCLSLMKLADPSSIIYCGAPLGIANQRGFWDAVRAPNVQIHRSAIESVSGEASSKEGAIISLADGTTLPLTDLLIQATGWKPNVPVEFTPPPLTLQLGLSCRVPRAVLADTDGVQDVKVDPEIKRLIQYWDGIDSVSASRIRRVFGPNSRPPKDVVESTTAPTDEFEFSPYRLFRRMVAPELVEDGDRSFVALGFVLTATTAVVAEVQALWAAAFLTGGLDDTKTRDGALDINAMSRSEIDTDVSEDVVWGGLTGVGPGVDTLNVRFMAYLISDIH